MDADLFRVDIHTRRGAAPVEFGAAFSWWRAVIGDDETDLAAPTLALCGYGMEMDSRAARRVQKFDMCASDILSDQTAIKALASLSPATREGLLERGLPGAGRSYGFPFRLEVVVLDSRREALLTPMGGVALPVSASDAIDGALNPRLLAARWAAGLLPSAGVSICPSFVRLPGMTHALAEGVWRVICVVDLRQCAPSVRAHDLADILAPGDPDIRAVPVEPDALARNFADAPGGPHAHTRVTGDALQAVVHGRL